MHSSKIFHLSCCLLAVSYCAESSNFETIQQSLISFCSANDREVCIAKIRAEAQHIEDSIWAKLVSSNFNPEDILSDRKLQGIIESALKGDASGFLLLHRLNPTEYAYEPTSKDGLESFFKNSENLPLRLSSSQKTLELLREYLDNLPEEQREYDFGKLVTPFSNPKFNQIFLAMRNNEAFVYSFPLVSIGVEHDDEINFIIDEMLLLSPYKARNFLKLFRLKVVPSPLEQANIDWNSVAVKKETLRTLWENRYKYTAGAYFDALVLPFYQKIEKLKLHLFGPSTTWCYHCTLMAQNRGNVNLLETKYALAPAPEEWNLHAKLGLYFGLSRFLVKPGNVSVLYSFEELFFARTSVHYEPLEQAYRKLFLENPAEEKNKMTWQKIYNATFREGNNSRQNGRFVVIQSLNLNDPFMFEVFHKEHYGSIVIRGSRLWFSDRARTPISGIDEYEMKAEENRLDVLKKFLYAFLGLGTSDLKLFDKVQLLIEQTYRKVQTIPLGTQYTGNCTLQAWLLGLRCAFISMGMPHEKYRLLTSTARDIVWNDAINAVQVDESYKLPMLMTHIMANEGEYELKGFMEVTPELLLQARDAFFYPSSHIHTYEMASDVEDIVRHVLEKKASVLAKSRTNGDAILEKVLDSKDEYHPYLRILSMCLMRQGEGVASYVETLKNKSEVLEEARKFSQRVDFTFVHAVLYSANRFGKEIRSGEFEAVWELTFGREWSLFIPGLFTPIRTLPLIALEQVPTAKALFYASLLITYCANPKKNFGILAAKFNPAMIKRCPQLKYFDDAIRRKGDEPVSLESPFLLYFPNSSKMII